MQQTESLLDGLQLRLNNSYLEMKMPLNDKAAEDPNNGQPRKIIKNCM